MTFGIIAILIMIVVLIVLLIVITKLFRSDDFDEAHIVATYERNAGIRPTRMVKAGSNFCMVYENDEKTSYGIGVGESLDDLELVRDVKGASLVSIAAEGSNIIWSHEEAGRLTTFLCDLEAGEFQILCEKQEAPIVPGYVGIFEGYVYFAKEFADTHRLAVVRHNIETGDELEIESVGFFHGITRPIKEFRIIDDVMNVVEQDSLDEIRLVAVALGTRVKGTTTIGVMGQANSDNYIGCLDDITDVAPNMARMTYMTIGRENDKEALYEISDKKFRKCAFVDNGKAMSMSLGVFEGIVYWIEERNDAGKITPVLHGYNSQANQHIINIIGVSSYTICDHNLYYFYNNEEKNILALCCRPAMGHIKTLNMDEIKAQRKAEKQARRAKKKGM